MGKVETGDLDKMIEAVEAGRKPSFPEIARGVGGDNAQDVEMAFEGKLDAAKRLHDALLPGMFWNMGHIDRPSLGYVCTVADGHFADSPSWRGYAMDPARAWLLSILKALQAKGEA